MTAGVSLVVLLFLLGSSIAVAAGMGLAGLILNGIYSPMPMNRIVGELSWSTTSNFILTAIPFYIMFGEILLRSGTAERMYAALVQWLSWLPGGLMHSNIGSCALFGSVSGSSVATAATIGVVAMGEIDKNKYNEPLFLGTLGGRRDAGHPDPALDQHDHLRRDDRHVGAQALSRGLPAGLHPDGAVQPHGAGRLPVEAGMGRHEGRDQLGDAHQAAARPAAAAGAADDRDLLHLLRHRHGDRGGRRRHRRRARRSPRGAAGCRGACCATSAKAPCARRRWSWRSWSAPSSSTSSSRPSASPSSSATSSRQWQLSPVQVLGAVIVLYLVLGTFMEELSMMISTIPITTPLMVQAGYDPVWYGILLVLLIQTAMISPPFGINLFVIHGIRGRGTLSDVEKGSAPFVVALLAMIAMICVWPDIVMIAVRWFGDEFAGLSGRGFPVFPLRSAVSLEETGACKTSV